MAPPWWWCLWVSCVRIDSTFRPTVEMLRGGSFRSHPNPYRGLAGNVANMLATCRPDSQMLAHYFSDMPLSWQYKIDPDTHFCVGDGQHSPLSSFRVPEVHTDKSSVRPGMRVWLGEPRETWFLTTQRKKVCHVMKNSSWLRCCYVMRGWQNKRMQNRWGHDILPFFCRRSILTLPIALSG